MAESRRRDASHGLETFFRPCEPTCLRFHGERRTFREVVDYWEARIQKENPSGDPDFYPTLSEVDDNYMASSASNDGQVMIDPSIIKQEPDSPQSVGSSVAIVDEVLGHSPSWYV